MRPARGLITAQLEVNDSASLADLIPLVNQRIQPPTPLTETDIHIRAMYLVSDQTNSFGGRFPVDEHPRLAELLIDSPVLVGHRRDLLPIGRTFHAVCVEQGGRNWIKSYFYWLKSAEGAETLRDNIDGGIYKECSIGFVYSLPECSVCGKDIRICQHEPMQSYAADGESRPCHFNYRQIERVLETSLVFRGATPDTSITRDLTISKSNGIPESIAIATLAELPPAVRYLVTPRYEGIDVLLTRSDNRWTASRMNGDEVNLSLELEIEPPSGNSPRHARLVGFRGKDRCSATHLERFLATTSGPVTRVAVYLYPEVGESSQPSHDVLAGHNNKMIRSRLVGPAGLESAISLLMTRDGVEIRPQGEKEPTQYFVFKQNGGTKTETPAIKLTRFANTDDWILDVRSAIHRQFIVRQFDITRFRREARFVAEPVMPPLRLEDNQPAQLTWHDGIFREEPGGILIDVGEKHGGTLCLQSITLRGEKRFLFFRTTSFSPRH